MKKAIYILIIISLLGGTLSYEKQNARAGWYDGHWTYRKVITVQSSKVETTETSFPVLVSVTDPNLRSTGNGGHVAEASGYDIIFTDDDDVLLLDFEIESWNSTTGEIQAWVESDISTTVDKVIYMYYGNSSATDISDATGVWDVNYVMVQHMQETDIDGGDGDIKDSTQYVNNGTTYAMDISNQVAGKIGGSFDFDDNETDYINFGSDSNIDITNEITVEFWIKAVFDGAYGTIARKLDANGWVIQSNDSGTNARARVDTSGGQNQWNYLSTTLDGFWHKITCTWANGVEKHYNNNVLVLDSTYSHGGGFDADSADLLVGASSGELYGIIDEFRISNIARSENWIETEYNNQNSPETFLAFGSEERDSYYLMASDNYKIEKDSINFGGTDDGQSDTYKLSDTMGEVGTGFSESDTYQVYAGYRQMSETYLAITSPTDVTMSPDIGGVSGGTGNGQAAWTVTTDSSGGYSLDIKASSAPAMQSGANSFADYTPTVSGTPDYDWSVAVAGSEFGFTPEGNDIISKFKDDGVDTCNTGSNDTANQCWSNLSISYENIAGSPDPNHPNGTATTVKFRAESGSSHLQVEGSYQTTVTVTAAAL